MSFSRAAAADVVKYAGWHEKTRELLISAPHLTIAEVCRQTGWESERYPKRIFLRRFGLTMREARQG